MAIASWDNKINESIKHRNQLTWYNIQTLCLWYAIFCFFSLKSLNIKSGTMYEVITPEKFTNFGSIIKIYDLHVSNLLFYVQPRLFSKSPILEKKNLTNGLTSFCLTQYMNQYLFWEMDGHKAHDITRKIIQWFIDSCERHLWVFTGHRMARHGHQRLISSSQLPSPRSRPHNDLTDPKRCFHPLGITRVAAALSGFRLPCLFHVITVLSILIQGTGCISLNRLRPYVEFSYYLIY